MRSSLEQEFQNVFVAKEAVDHEHKSLYNKNCLHCEFRMFSKATLLCLWLLMLAEAANRASVAGSVLSHRGCGFLSVWLWELWWFEGPEGLDGLELRADDCRSNYDNSSGAVEEKVVMLRLPHSADAFQVFM